VRKASQSPICSAAFVTHEIVTQLLLLYDRLLPHLNAPKLSRDKAMWMLAEHVFVPTAFLIVVKRHRHGLGSEFRGDDCWYLPKRDGHETKNPVQRVLDCWLRVAGYRTAYGISKELNDEDGVWRRKLGRWLSGTPAPLADLHRLVDTFARSISWLDEPNEWKGRFTLASAAEGIWDRIDEYFAPFHQSPALYFAEVFRGHAKKPVLEDDGGVLAEPHTFFATRLVEKRLKETGQLGRILRQVRRSWSAQYGPDVSDQEISDHRRQMEWEMNPGNWFADYLLQRARKEDRIGQTASWDDAYHLSEYLFDLGVKELNRSLARK
jgi:hypothetical protein